jgi:hypothetical protein
MTLRQMNAHSGDEAQATSAYAPEVKSRSILLMLRHLARFQIGFQTVSKNYQVSLHMAAWRPPRALILRYHHLGDTAPRKLLAGSDRAKGS